MPSVNLASALAHGSMVRVWPTGSAASGRASHSRGANGQWPLEEPQAANAHTSMGGGVLILEKTHPSTQLPPPSPLWGVACTKIRPGDRRPAVPEELANQIWSKLGGGVWVIQPLLLHGFGKPED
uniref:Uncharacterized protein n=1 Tax=Eutreptiella gymnastica TaxID=73025 RepID=A0A7S1IQ03_9EUGL|mmetsp:Transcript_34127/g.61165  ORF Transcript_34127/g.61165 Transcript_34127/m.61165 type:complete len:125 (+) Transcript_34127:206-580(+)